jgi:valyl-tRNA synthetase
MIMMGCHFTGKAPFREVHLTGLVRDARGQKMSKTKGNVMDPLDLVDEFGADAVRFTLAALASPGRDLPLDAKRMEGYRAFGTKIWNAARFVQMHLDGSEPELAEVDTAALALPEAWILAELERTTIAVNRALESYRFDEACRELYQFMWNDYCDWYVEMAKPVLQGSDQDGRRGSDVRAVARGVLIEALKLLHPVMPFITEEIAQHLGCSGMLIGARYPRGGERDVEQGAVAVMAAFQAVVQETRSYRHMVGLPPSAHLAVFLSGLDPRMLAAFERLAPEMRRLGGLSALELNPAAVPGGAVHDVAAGVQIAIVLPEGALGEAERKRLAADLGQAQAELGRITARLDDPGFAQRAPADVVEGARERLSELARKAQMLTATLGGEP